MINNLRAKIVVACLEYAVVNLYRMDNNYEHLTGTDMFTIYERF
jgi:hypothetical protein